MLSFVLRQRCEPPDLYRPEFWVPGPRPSRTLSVCSAAVLQRSELGRLVPRGGLSPVLRQTEIVTAGGLCFLRSDLIPFHFQPTAPPLSLNCHS